MLGVDSTNDHEFCISLIPGITKRIAVQMALSHYAPSLRARSLTSSDSGQPKGHYVRVHLAGANSLSLAEVEISGYAL
jgi:hypothetical protein